MEARAPLRPFRPPHPSKHLDAEVRRSLWPPTVSSHQSGVAVQLSILGLNLIYAALGVVLMYVSYRVIDRLTPEVDFPAELKRGNIAVAIFIAALFIAIALIVGRAIG